MKRRTIAATLLGATLVLAGCAASGAPPSVPALMAETIPKPPVSPTSLIWQPGHWDWTGSAYVWIPGQYVGQADHGGLWMPAYWERTESGWVWHPARWM